MQPSARYLRNFLKRQPSWLPIAAAALALSIAASCHIVLGQTLAAKEDARSPLLSAPPRSWAVDVAASELVALHHPGSYLRYRMHVVDEKGNQTRDIIESKDGSVARLILRDGRQLTDEEDKAERQRLNDMIAAPSAFAKHIKDDAAGRKIADQMIHLMPDAMIYTYTPGQPQSGRNGGAPEVVLDYEPNPAFKPPSLTSEALTGLKGRMWVDAKSRHLVRMEGTIFRSVNFGWGMLAHLYPGGRLVLEQTDADNGRWIFTRFTEEVRVRALMVKTVTVHADIGASAFQTLPGPMSYQDAIHLLLSTPLPGR